MKKNPFLDFIYSSFLYLFIPFIVFFPCLFLGQAYFDDDLLAFFGAAWPFLKSCLLGGHFPFWNPYLFAGQPFFADPNTASSYPLLYPALIFPVAYGIGVFNLIHVFLAATGMHFWLKQFSLSREACWLGALSFALSGFVCCEMIHPSVLAAYAWFPWFLGFLEKLSRSLKPSMAFLAGFAFALLFLTGFFQLTLGVFYAGLPYFIFRNTTARERDSLSFAKKVGQQGFKKYFFPAIAFVWGLLPLFILLLPFAEFIHFSDRLHDSLDYEGFNAGISLKPQSLYHFLFPFPALSTQPYPWAYLSNNGYLGLWAPFFVWMALDKKEKGLKIFLAVFALLALLTGLGKYFPLHFWLCRLVPGFSLLRSPFRFMFIYSAFVSALMAFGCDALLKKAKNPTSYRPILLCHLLVYVAFILLAALGTGAPRETWLQVTAMVIGGAALYLWFQSASLKNTGKTIFFSWIFLSLVTTSWTLIPSRLGPNFNFDFEKETPLISKIKEHVGEARVFLGDNIPYPVETNHHVETAEFPTNSAWLFGLKNVGGYDPLSLVQRGELHSLPFTTFIKLMAVQGFVTGNEKGDVPGFTRYQWDGVKFYESKDRMPLVYAPVEVRFTADPIERLSAMRQKDFNPYSTAYLSEPLPKNSGGHPFGQKAALEYRLLADGLNSQTYLVKMNAVGLAVFSEVNYPGWKAWVDGKPAKILTANHLFRGLFVPEGKHEIKFSFEPAWFRLVSFGFLVWVLLTLLGWRLKNQN